MRIGTAGWTIASEASAAFAGDGRHIERYARVLTCAEINSSFHRPHRTAVYERWAAQTPEDFRFSVKLPKAITHAARLRRVHEPLRQFLSEAAGLGPRWAVVLVQLPPSFAFEARPVRNFFGLLGDSFAGAIACEPRHASWFTDAADRLLASCRVARVAADPALVPRAATPGGWLGIQTEGALVYHRWHGSPRVYWSRYDAAWLRTHASGLARLPRNAEVWCIFDNTAGGAGISNALELTQLVDR